jgi:hypothetical protein
MSRKPPPTNGFKKGRVERGIVSTHHAAGLISVSGLDAGVGGALRSSCGLHRRDRSVHVVDVEPKEPCIPGQTAASR